MPDQRLRARSPDIAQSHSSDLRVRTRFVLALMSLIFLFVLGVVVIANPSFVSFITVFFVVLFAVLAVFLNLIFPFGGTASPRSATTPKNEPRKDEDHCENLSQAFDLLVVFF